MTCAASIGCCRPRFRSGADLLVPGQPVEIIAGPLSGVQGTLVRHGGQMRLVVEVNFLQQAVSAEVESWMVEPVSRPITHAAAG